MAKVKDITGKRYGRLTVIEKAGYYISPGGKRFLRWLCKCDCGNFKTVITSKLNNGHTKSCGCLQVEIQKQKLEMREKDRFNNTRILMLTSKEYKNNTSGHKGVCYRARNEKWMAYITIKKKKMHLGEYKNKEDAIKARKEAEEKYFKPIIEEFNKEKEK